MAGGRSRGFRRAFAALVSSLVLAFAAAPRAEIFNPETFTLANGMEAVVVPNHRAPVVFHMVWYRVGAADDPMGQSGLAHLLEHLMFKGTEKVPGGAFSEIVARNGGNENAFTSLDYTAYFQKVAKDRLELVMGLEADRMVNLTLSAEDVATERDVVMEERRSRVDNEPGALLAERMAAAQYLQLHYRIPTIGWAGELATVGREDALRFYRRHYAPDNAILIVVGDVTAAEVRPLAERIYGAIPARGIGPRQRLSEPPQLAARRLVMRDSRVRQPSWQRTYLAPSAYAGAREHADALEVLAEILGGGTTSRLYRALAVEKKLAAGAGAWYDPVQLALSRFGLYATPAPGVEVGALEAAVDDEVARLLREGVGSEEVARVTKRMIAEATYARDSLYLAARAFGEALTAGLSVADVESWPERIAAVTPEAVMAAARAVLRPETSVTGVLMRDGES